MQESTETQKFVLNRVKYLNLSEGHALFQLRVCVRAHVHAHVHTHACV